ncbi:thiol:disulfide interchange protein DsbA/DsbL [Haemophilus sp. SZY H52]|uniref:thiol:disulfide interchange protein DsbA/DsbL n=2 Tax=Haemophilus TaxID=724 RepID=UPI00351182A2
MKKVWQNKLLKGSFAMILLSVTDIAFSEVNSKSFSVQNSPHLPSANIIQFEDGRDYFSYQEPIVQAKRNDRKIPIQFFFDYDCRVCSSAQDILQLYSQIRPNKLIFKEYPVATNEDKFSAIIFYTLQRLNASELSDALLFETSEKARYTELSSLDKMSEWAALQGINQSEFEEVASSIGVKEDVNNAIDLTEEYGVFTFPYVVVDGKYVLTASTLYNDDYSVAVLDFLVNKIEQERKQ